jgi:dimethylpropiothetin dethiomethylase
VSENDQGVYAPGSLIFNPPEQVHRITVADSNPALLLYAWEGSKANLADQKMVFTRKSR